MTVVSRGWNSFNASRRKRHSQKRLLNQESQIWFLLTTQEVGDSHVPSVSEQCRKFVLHIGFKVQLFLGLCYFKEDI
jgi:hypothetical protein